MMYNLLVTSGANSWDEPSYIFGLGCFLEHTEDDLKARFASLDQTTVATLTKLPSLFAYEHGVDQAARIGRIKTIKKRGSEVRITYEFDQTIPPIDEKSLAELLWDLEVGGSEMSRTHWAVKSADLMQIIQKSGLIRQPGTVVLSERFSRATIINACDILKTLGHPGFDRFLLELGIDGMSAGRDRGGLLDRANALSEFVIAHQYLDTAERTPLGLAVVIKAAMSDRSYPDGGLYNVNDENRRAFWSGLSGDGYQYIDGNIISVGTASPSEQFPSTPFLPPTPQRSTPVMVAPSPITNKVFLVHGRDHSGMHEVARYLERLNLDVVILHERPNGGRTLISKFREESADIRFAVVLMTPDDEGQLKGTTALAPRARQNVVFELGFFIGKLGPDRVCSLVAGELDKPSDFDAVVYIQFGSNTSWRTELARELRAANIPFDYSKVF